MNRTLTQNRAYQKGLAQLEKIGYDHGLSAKLLIEKTDVPVTKDFLHILFKAVAKSMYGVDSTTKLTTVQISKVWDVFIKPIEEETGEYLPFPSQEQTDNYLQSFTK